MKVRNIPQYSIDDSGKRIKRPSKKLYAVFVDQSAVLRRLPLSADRKSAGELARTVDRLVSMKSAGSESVLPPELSRVLDDLPGPMRQRLKARGIIASEGKPIVAYVDDWQAALLAKGKSAGHANKSAERVRRIIAGCGFISVSRVTPAA